MNVGTSVGTYGWIEISEEEPRQFEARLVDDVIANGAGPVSARQRRWPLYQRKVRQGTAAASLSIDDAVHSRFSTRPPFALRMLTMIDAALCPAAASHPQIIGSLLLERYVRIRVRRHAGPVARPSGRVAAGANDSQSRVSSASHMTSRLRK